MMMHGGSGNKYVKSHPGCQGWMALLLGLTLLTKWEFSCFENKM